VRLCGFSAIWGRALRLGSSELGQLLGFVDWIAG
jgi:hypothetical protein